MSILLQQYPHNPTTNFYFRILFLWRDSMTTETLMKESIQLGLLTIKRFSLLDVWQWTGRLSPGDGAKRYNHLGLQAEGWERNIGPDFNLWNIKAHPTEIHFLQQRHTSYNVTPGKSISRLGTLSFTPPQQLALDHKTSSRLLRYIIP